MATTSETGGKPHVSGTLGIWLSKRAVEAMEFPFRHRLTHQPGGWRLDVLEAGKLIARIGDRRDAFDVEEGDFVISAAEDIYLALNREGRDASGRPLPPPDAEPDPPRSPKRAPRTSASAATGRKRTAKGA